MGINENDLGSEPIDCNDIVNIPLDQMAQPKKEGYITKDSGKRHEFSTGMKRDTSEDKPMYHLLIPLDIPVEEQRLCKVFKGTDNEIIVNSFLDRYLNGNSKIILQHITHGKGIEDFAWLLTRGAVKYESRNREKAKTLEEFDRFVESACRHFFQYIFEINTEEDHKSATAFNIMGAETTKFKINQVK